MLNFKIDEERCTQCGQCVADCPAHCIVMDYGAFPGIPEEQSCIRCQHCLAVCPTAALSILGADPDESLQTTDALPTAESMELLIKGRRSTRQFKPQALDGQTIRRLLETAWYAPTAVNAQCVLFTATMNLETIAALRKELYAKVEKLLAASTPEKNEDFFHLYLRRFLAAYHKHGADGILRDAPHILIASAPPTAPQPKTDCTIALSYLDLLAPTMGIGTVWNGILTRCITEYFPELATRLGVPADHEIGYCMSFGLPAVHYHRTVQRSPAGLNLLESFGSK
jgi:nitroreductase/NAD-dependent dihydropyrimidine dehydrogenase PreA subunit